MGFQELRFLYLCALQYFLLIIFCFISLKGEGVDSLDPVAATSCLDGTEEWMMSLLPMTIVN